MSEALETMLTSSSGEAALAGSAPETKAAPGEGEAETAFQAGNETAAESKQAEPGKIKTALTAGFDDDEGAAAGDEKEAAPASDYDLKFSEGVSVDTELLASFSGVAKEIGLDNDQAQKLATLYEAHIAKTAATWREAQNKALMDYIKTEESAIAAEPGGKENMVYAAKAFKAFGSKELADLMNQTAIGSSRPMVSFFAKIGRMAEKYGEPGFEGTSSPAKGFENLADKLWPNGGRGVAE